MTTGPIKIAGAPISWGVCEVPDWGIQMEPTRVLTEMSELGLGATEFGPDGFLPNDPAAKAQLLKEYNMVAVGGFYPVLLHDKDYDPIPKVQEDLLNWEAAGAGVLVLAASTGVEGYDAKRPVLSDEQWKIMFENLKRISELAATKGVKAVIHPHVGTMVETEADITKVLEGTPIAFCLDTGHMIIGGTDPVEFAKNHADRIGHSHLKDVDMSVARKVRDSGMSYYDGVVAGMYKPLGQGDVDIASIVKSLVASGYDGWFALEQDKVVTEDPRPGEGPITDAKASVEFLRAVIAEINS